MLFNLNFALPSKYLTTLKNVSCAYWNETNWST